MLCVVILYKLLLSKLCGLQKNVKSVELCPII
nr:MAG TPA: hypothetical protein [Caudoviricetes sp.]DAP91085.1 MAG TPA: hypothetical protein [Caudoviricetes sp.]